MVGESSLRIPTPPVLRPWTFLVLVGTGLYPGCREAKSPEPGEPASRVGDEISVCGQLYHTGTKVVLWNDPGGFDAYRLHRHSDPSITAPSSAPDHVARFDSFRKNLTKDLRKKLLKNGWTVDVLQKVITQVVIHYDACGTSQQCFHVLHDVRGLSCHFLLDLDGTIYQTLDVKERAWHASTANDRSIGIELAHIGCYPDPQHELFSRWYEEDDAGTTITVPASLGDGGLPPGLVARPARSGLVKGEIHGRTFYQYDFTESQYRALEQLLITLCRIFPLIQPQVPRDGDGVTLSTVLADQEFQGILGHYHVSAEKRDPGPAFDWERILRRLSSD